MEAGAWTTDVEAVMRATEEGAVGTIYEPGSSADFDRLYLASYAGVVRTLVGILGSQAEAEDCAQDSFCRAFKAWGRWRGDYSAEVWIHRIAINTAISELRKRKVRDVMRLVQRQPRPVPADPTAGLQTAAVLAALRRLKPREAAAVVLRHYNGYNNREIAQALGVSERTVGARIAAGLARLREDPELR